jgi:hypothetical protein
MSGGGGGGSYNTINENPLPDWAQPSVANYLSRANTLSGDPSAYETYTGITYAPRNQNEIDGIAALTARGTNGSPIVTKGKVALTQILELAIDANIEEADDSFDKLAEIAIEAFEEEILPSVTIAALQMGRYGGDSFHRLQAKAARKAMNSFVDLANNHYYDGRYLFERNVQNQMLPANIAFGNQDVVDAELLHQAGMYEREYQQELLEDAFRKWLDEQEGSVRRLEIMGNAIRAMVGAQVTTTEPYYRPGEWNEVAGIALAGVGLLANFSGVQPAPTPEQVANQQEKMIKDRWITDKLETT